MLTPNIFNQIFVFPILNLLVVFYALFLALHIPGALGFAIILLTVLVRLLLHPFFHHQLQTSKKLQDIKPHLDKLHLKHKKDPKKLQQEQLRLYQEAGINPASGCLFMIIQIPIFIALFNTLNLFLSNGNGAKVISEINKVLYFPQLKIASIDPWFFGFNLALTPQKAGLGYYYMLPLVTGLLQFYQAKVSMPPSVENKSAQPPSAKASGGKEEFQKAMNTQMKYVFPILVAWFSFSLPVGLSLYWNIFSIFSIIQYRKLKMQSPNLKSTS